MHLLIRDPWWVPCWLWWSCARCCRGTRVGTAIWTRPPTQRCKRTGVRSADLTRTMLRSCHETVLPATQATFKLYVAIDVVTEGSELHILTVLQFANIGICGATF